MQNFICDFCRAFAKQRGCGVWKKKKVTGKEKGLPVGVKVKDGTVGPSRTPQLGEKKQDKHQAQTSRVRKQQHERSVSHSESTPAYPITRDCITTRNLKQKCRFSSPHSWLSHSPPSTSLLDPLPVQGETMSSCWFYNSPRLPEGLLGGGHSARRFLSLLPHTHTAD